MEIIVKQVSSLEKIRLTEIGDINEVYNATVLKGETFSYQLAVQAKETARFDVQIEDTSFKGDVNIYMVQNAIMDMAADVPTEDNFITLEPGLMPDILVPAEKENYLMGIYNGAGALWVEVKIPKDIEPGEYQITVSMSRGSGYRGEWVKINKTMKLNVIDAVLPKQTTKFTQWFHVDCIADIHNVPVYSEEHWTLIDKYMALARQMGINMILTPVITPPLDTGIGLTRPCTQLVKIEKQGDTFVFDFALLDRWVELCKKNGIEYFEIAHLFSQWGLKYAPNIKVLENGKEDYMFGWHTEANCNEYREFLTQFVPAVIKFFEDRGLKDKIHFHLSDEPNTNHLSAYKYAYDLVHPLLEGCPIMDAISHYEFYENRFIDIPVTGVYYIDDFLGKDVKNQWVYYCCSSFNGTSNRFLSMGSGRNRIMGLQIYKFGIYGFLHWGYNFYYSEHSKKLINPYITTSGDKNFPSGDPFSVYPYGEDVIPSLRAVVFRDALMDVEICRMLEAIIGREKVIEMIDEAAGEEITFSKFPRDNNFVPALMEKMKGIIKEHIGK